MCPQVVSSRLEAGSTIIPAPGRSNWDLDLVRNIRGATRQITRQGLIDIIVEGTLRMEGRWLSGISVADLQEKRPSSWGGLLAVGKGRIEISRASLYLADTAVALFDESQARINRSKFKSNLAAMEAFHESSLTVEDSTISANPGGIALYNHSQAFVKDCWLRFNSSAVLIADRSKATIQGNILFRNVLALSSLDASSSRIEGNYFIANGTGIRLGQKAKVKKRDNWSLLERTPLDDEREQTVSAPAL